MDFLSCTCQPPPQLRDQAGGPGYVPGRVAKAILDDLGRHQPGPWDLMAWQGGPLMLTSWHALHKYIVGLPEYAKGTILTVGVGKSVAVLLDGARITNAAEERFLLLHELGHKLNRLWKFRYGRYLYEHPNWQANWAVHGSKALLSDGKKRFPNPDEYWSEMYREHSEGQAGAMPFPVKDFVDRVVFGRPLD